MKTVFAVLAGLLFVLALTWVFQGNDFFMYKYFAPRQEAVRRQVFEQSRAFNQGMIQELENMHLEYVRSSPEQKAAMRSIILHRVSGYNLNDPSVPSDLVRFIDELRAQDGL